MTSPKAPPITDEPEVVKRARNALTKAFAGIGEMRVTLSAPDLEALLVLAAAPRAGVGGIPIEAAKSGDEFVLVNWKYGHTAVVHWCKEHDRFETRNGFSTGALDSHWDVAMPITATPPAVSDPHAELVAAAYAFKAADEAHCGASIVDWRPELEAIRSEAASELLRAAERLPDRDGGAE